MVWEGRLCRSSSQGEQTLFPSIGSERAKGGKRIFHTWNRLLSSFGKSRQEQGVSQRTITAETPPYYRCPVRTNIRGYFDLYWFVRGPVLLHARTSSGHNAEQYWLLLRTTTGSLADQYWFDFPPPTALNLNSADFALTEQIKGIGLPPCGGRPMHVRRERE